MSSGAETATWDFFISYTAVDKDWAVWIAWQLELAEYRVLIQEWDFGPGAHWMASMDLGMAKSRRTIAVCSEAYMRSGWGQMEWHGALQADSSGTDRKLVPIRVADCELSPLLRQVVWVDLVGLTEGAARNRLLGAIEHVVTGRAKPSQSPAFPGVLPTRVSVPGLHPPTPPPSFPGPGGSTLTSAAFLARSGGTRVAPLTEHDPTVIGPYTLRYRLGAGLLSTVYLGEDDKGRTAAVKTSGSPERLAREARHTRAVRSVHVPAVLGAGSAPPYLATEYADGTTLAERVALRGPFTATGLHQFAVHLLGVLADVHRAGIVHGDVAPGNVILSASGPRLIDFGAARPDGDRPRGPRAEGTANVMAPELWRNSVVTTAADVFAWGCLVTYAGTRRWPFPGATEDEVRGRILGAAPGLTGLAQPVRGAVRAALHREPASRPTVADLLGRLTEAPAARPVSAPRFGRRALFTSGGAVLAMAANAGLTRDTAAGPAAPPRDPAARAEVVAVTADRLRSRDPDLAARLDLAAYLIRSTPRTRANVLRHTEMTRLSRHSGPVKGLAFDPSSGLLASAGYDGAVRLWDPRDNHARQAAEPLRNVSSVLCVAFGPAGLVAFGDVEGLVTIARPERGDPRSGRWRRRTFPAHPPGQEVLRVRFGPTGGLLASSSVDGTVRIWNPVDPTLPLRVLDHADRAVDNKWVWGMDFCAGDRMVVTAGDSSTGSSVKLWSLDGLDADRPDPAPVRQQLDMSANAFAGIGHVATDPADDRVVFVVSAPVAQGGNSDVRVLRLRDGDDGLGRASVIPGHSGFATLAVALSPDGTRLATGNEDPRGPTVRLWDRADTTVSTPLPGLADKVWATAFSPDGAFLAAGAENGDLGLWATDPERAADRLEPPTEDEWFRLFPSLLRPVR
ncbi:TIR domain-containing protein [Herbidospora galbida]|uniref:TIR domain-containing protein n=1 Tax=Herbidospora galbida TaxID=2575442 RepID=A0A4U3LZQ1_9ACTN|nr:TIR domain-containing protein [Herbidospora galbida]TKK80944.1 TIR domain-containing protein [Herbidospora galbida]